MSTGPKNTGRKSGQTEASAPKPQAPAAQASHGAGSSTEIHVFFAHAGGQTPKIDDDVVLLARDLARAYSTVAFDVVPGHADHAKHFASCGGWDEWAKHIAADSVPGTQRALYDMVVVPTERLPDDTRMGRATASIVRCAIKVGMDCLLWRRELVAGRAHVTLFKIVNVRDVNPKDWKTGWAPVLDAAIVAEFEA
jgi:hypothetical protein